MARDARAAARGVSRRTRHPTTGAAGAGPAPRPAQAAVHRQLALALHRQGAQRLGPEFRPRGGRGGLAQVHGRLVAQLGEARGEVDGVAPDVEAELLAPDHAADDGAEVDADAHRPAAGQGGGGLDDGEAAAGGGERRLGVGLEQVGGGEDGVADGVDLLQAVRRGEVLAGAGEAVELGHDLLGRVPVAVAGEAHHVGQQHGHALEAAGGDAAGGLQLGRGGAGRMARRQASRRRRWASISARWARSASRSRLRSSEAPIRARSSTLLKGLGR